MGSLLVWVTVTRILLSECSICLTWKLHENFLKFRCQTTEMNAEISFFDQYNREQAYCVLPYQSSLCISYNNNRKIYQNITSKETILEIRDQIGNHLNGQWSCHYGRNLEIGYVDVKIIPQRVYQLFGKNIRITGASMIKTGKPMWLSCFSNIPFMVKKVKFYANNDLYITLTKDKSSCHSSSEYGDCEPDQCHCSEDGNTYFIKHNGFPIADNVSLQCKMEFELGLEMTDCIFVHAIDLDKPRIIQDQNQQWFAMDYVKTICYALVQRIMFKLEWDCFNLTPISTIRNGTLIISTLSFQVRSYMNNKICTCKSSYKKLKSATSFTVKVSKAPALVLNNKFVCNQSTTICIVCVARSELQIVHFGSWIHLYNAQIIRFVNGSNNSSSSTIKFDGCSFEDEGEYVCQAQSNENGLVFLSNTSTKVVVKGPPYLVNTAIFDEPIIKVSVQIYSAPPPVSIEWFVGKDVVKNSTRFEQILEISLVKRKMHGKAVSKKGYTASLKINNYSTRGISSISIVVKNEFGNVTKIFVLNENKFSMTTSLNYRNVLFIIFGVVILLVMIAVSAIQFQLRSRRQNALGSVYFAATPQEPNVHTYDTSDQISQYEEIAIDDIQNAQLNENPQNLLEEADKDDKEDYEAEDGYQVPHDYLEVF